MKNMIINTAVFVLVSAISVTLRAEGNGGVTNIISCTGDLLGAPKFTIQRVDATANSPVIYRLVKQVDNPSFGPYMTTFASNEFITYGGTVILTQNQGRSGYAHLYWHDNITVIDIDLFQNQDMNTNGPLTRYKCARAQE